VSRSTQPENKWVTIRYAIIVLLILGFGAYIAAAIFRIAFVEKKTWQAIAEKEKSRLPNNVIYPERGNIYALDGSLMATSFPLYTLYIDFRDKKAIDSLSFLMIPKVSKPGAVPTAKQIEASRRNGVDSLAYYLSRKSGKNEARLKADLLAAYRRRDASYPVTSGPVSYFDMKEISQYPYFRLGRFRSGLIKVESIMRDNPYLSLAQRTIGAIHLSRDTAGYSRGRAGLELQYDSLLRGKTGLLKKQRVGGEWIDHIIREAEQGMDIRTTIDLDIQFIAEKALRRMMSITEAEAGSVVVMDVPTGEIRAISNMGRTPSGAYAELGNYAAGDMIEPGSIFKVASIMVALDDTVCTPTDWVDAGRGSFRYKGADITDHNRDLGGNGVITVEEAIIRSSNIGVSKIIIEGYEKNPGRFVDGLYRLGLTEDLRLEIPGAGRPVIRRPNKNNWYPLALPYMSFGYETNVPPLYMLAFYNAIANKGRMMRPLFVKEVMQDGKTLRQNKPEVIKDGICSPKTLHAVRKMLAGVVENERGTGRLARSNLVKIAGKTGSAQIGEHGGYRRNVLNVSFAGYFPADDPQYSCIAVIRRPKRRASGGDAAAGVIKDIAEGIFVSRSPVDVRKMAGAENVSPVPPVKSGDAKAALSVMKTLDLKPDRSGLESPWASVSREGGRPKLTALNVAEGLTPSVEGMGAKDAVFLLETMGLNVRLSGRGRVAEQSIAAGQKIVKGRTIHLTLK
jgi:cell division protein FtsI (penicillin-binding protein 3)